MGLSTRWQFPWQPRLVLFQAIDTIHTIHILCTYIIAALKHITTQWSHIELVLAMYVPAFSVTKRSTHFEYTWDEASCSTLWDEHTCTAVLTLETFTKCMYNVLYGADEGYEAKMSFINC